MPGVLTYAGRLMVAACLKGEGWGSSEVLELHMFSNESTAGVDADLPDFTSASFGGYAPVETTPGSMSATEREGDSAVVTIDGGPVVWDCTSGSGDVHGWYLYYPSGGVVIAFDVYDTPQAMVAGSRHTLIAKIPVGQCP